MKLSGADGGMRKLLHKSFLFSEVSSASVLSFSWSLSAYTAFDIQSLQRE